MTGLTMLWLPILLSAVLVFLVSFVLHMLLPFWHQGDYPKLANEDRVMEALRPLSLPPGDYMVPRPSGPQEMNSTEFVAKRTKGPVLIMTVMPSGPVTMGKSLVSWFIFSIVVAVVAGYVAGRALPPGAQYLQVFRFVGTTAFVAFAAGLWQMSIWYSRAWGTTIRYTVDGLIYASLMAGVFGWLWPK